MSPLRIWRILESDKLKTAPEAMDETVSNREEERIDEEDSLPNRNAAEWKFMTAKESLIRARMEELECSFGRVALPTARSRLI